VINVNVRIIAATNRNLEQDILSDRFRADLFYRLNVFPIYLPPLRERGSDVILLADHFLLKYSKEMGKNVKRISTAAIEVFLSHRWPGNVRELENCIERAVLLSKTDMVDCVHLPPSLQVREKELDRKERSKLSSVVEAEERSLIINALQETGGNQTKAAKVLGTTKRIIQYKISKLSINPKLFRRHNKNSDET
jgi:Nif-specific regulatory protein